MLWFFSSLFPPLFFNSQTTKNVVVSLSGIWLLPVAFDQACPLPAVRQAPRCPPELLPVPLLLLQSLGLEPATSFSCRVHPPIGKPPSLPHHCQSCWSGLA